MTMKVKFAAFNQVTRSRSFPGAIARHDMLRQASVDLVRTLLPAANGVRLLGATVSNFDQQSTSATDGLPLFEIGEVITRPSEGDSTAAAARPGLWRDNVVIPRSPSIVGASAHQQTS